MKKKTNESLSIAISAVVGSLTNTVLYLGLMILLFITSPAIVISALALVGVTNGIPEAIFAGIICTAVVKAVHKINK